VIDGVQIVSETYFLRNAPHFAVLADLLRERSAAGRRHLRVLSAGCSSGEEPYSIAMTARETLADFDAWAIAIDALDIDADALGRAATGEYSEWSLRATPDEARERWFTRAGKRYALAPALRSMVRFASANLVDPSPQLLRPEAYDVVFCRNVLMYYPSDTMAAVIERLARALTPGGLLFLGHAENLRGVSRDFHLRHSHETFYYERRDVLDTRPLTPPDVRVDVELAAPLPPDLSWFDTIARSTERIESLAAGAAPRRDRAPSEDATPRRPDVREAVDLMERERFADALAALHGAESDADAMLLRAALLVNAGEPGTAERTARALLDRDELNSGAHYVLALCREHDGDLDGAREHDEFAAHLDPAFAMPHLHLGLLARRRGELELARAELTLACGLLEREDASRLALFGGGFGREALVSICRAELAACEAGAA
jgi:chemotaxis protein methyltransferase CheR